MRRGEYEKIRGDVDGADVTFIGLPNIMIGIIFSNDDNLYNISAQGNLRVNAILAIKAAHFNTLLYTLVLECRHRNW